MTDNSFLIELRRLYENYHIPQYYGVTFDQFVNDVSICVPINELRQDKKIDIEARVLEVERMYLRRQAETF